MNQKKTLGFIEKYHFPERVISISVFNDGITQNEQSKGESMNDDGQWNI
ncbi:hypothetical protein [Vibrio sp. FJH11]